MRNALENICEIVYDKRIGDEMRKGSIVLFVIILWFIFATGSCQKYRQMEEQYQSDADIIRIQHFDYYAKLLSEYYEKNGKYPFQYEKDEQVYIYILNNFQEERFKDTNEYIHYSVDDKWFFDDLTNGLGREIDEKYDPQKISSDGRPNYYVYMVDGDYFYFAIHLYNNNHFTKRVAKYYYKMELSNIDSKEYMLFTYLTLKNDLRYIELINKKAKKQDFFDEMDLQNTKDSKN
jgi:hypothetical protein